MPPLAMNNVSRQHTKFKTEIEAKLSLIFESGNFINGPDVENFEKNLSSYLGVHVVSCANGTDALQLALMALPLRPGSEIITPTFSFAAAAEVITILGHKPVFADICPDTFNIDVEKIERLITSKTAAIIPVHLFGQSADMLPILDLAQKHNLWVIEDNAQALGGRYIEKPNGTTGHIGCTSFFPSKNLGCCGDGGAVYTLEYDLAENFRQLKNHGQSERFNHSIVGFNSRLDTIQAAILDIKLKSLDEFCRARRKISKLYDEILSVRTEITRPYESKRCYHTFNQYTIRIQNREQVMRKLSEKGISSAIYYPIPLHRQQAFKTSVSLPVADQISMEVLSLPIYPELKEEEAIFIAESICEALD